MSLLVVFLLLNIAGVHSNCPNQGKKHFKKEISIMTGGQKNKSQEIKSRDQNYLTK
jgi:hypothetical protein